GASLMGEQRFNFASQGIVARAGFGEEGRALVVFTLQRGVIEFLNFMPPFRFHHLTLSPGAEPLLQAIVHRPLLQMVSYIADAGIIAVEPGTIPRTAKAGEKKFRWHASFHHPILALGNRGRPMRQPSRWPPNRHQV